VTVEEMIGKNIADFSDAETNALATPYVLKGEGLPNNPTEIKLRRKDGTLFPAEVYGAGFSMGGKELRVVSLWDISKRKKAEEDLKQSEQSFRNLVEKSPDAMLLISDFKTVYANQSMTNLLGYSNVAELIGKSPVEFVFPDDAEFVKSRVGNLKVLGDSNPPIEKKLIRKDGQPVTTEIVSFLITFEGAPTTVVVARDLTERKKIESALVESEERFKRFAEVTKEGIFIHDNGLIVDANQALAEMLGVTVAEMIGKQSTDYADSEATEMLKKFKKEGYPNAPYETTLIRKDGTRIPAEIHGVGFTLSGKTMRVVRLWDITNRKKMEEALRQSEQSFRNLIEKSPDAITIHDPERTVYVNDAMLSLLGYTRAEEIVGTPSTFFVHPDDLASVQERIRNLKTPGDYNPPRERRFIRKDGRIVHVDVVSFMIYFEGAPVRVAVARDLTERKKAQEALEQSEKNFRNLIEKSPDGIFIHTLNETPKIVYVNRAMLNFLGYSSAEELINLRPEEFVRSKDLPSVRERIQRMREKGEYNPPQEKFFIHQNGELICAEVVSFLIHYEGVPMAAVVVRDLTERKKAEEALMKFERLSTIGEMAAGMAHEIRNPLAAISTAAQILQRKKLKENSGQVETILEQSDRLEKLVRDTLDYAKAAVVPAQNKVSVKTALESALNLSQIQFGPSHKMVKVQWNMPAEDVQVYADSGRVQQILVNLILNAFQIMNGKGELKLGLTTADGFALMRIEDNGLGITAENMKRIFEPFFTTKDHGSGLGLAISQRIAQEHGGKIIIERLQPQGTAFILQIPLGGEK
jgi:PAS domain S-box-containing protein